MSSCPGTPGPSIRTTTSCRAKHQSTRQIYETLVVYDETGKLVPWLAEKWEYENDLTLVMHLRKGVKFHNGDTLKASDVMFSLKRTREDKTPAQMQVDQVDFDKSSVVDDYTIKIVTKTPYALQLPLLENPLSAIICERSYKESNKDFNKAPVGTGPYKVVEYRSGDSLKLQGFDQYWIPGQPYVKNVTIPLHQRRLLASHGSRIRRFGHRLRNQRQRHRPHPRQPRTSSSFPPWAPTPAT